MLRALNEPWNESDEGHRIQVHQRPALPDTSKKAYKPTVAEIKEAYYKMYRAKNAEAMGSKWAPEVRPHLQPQRAPPMELGRPPTELSSSFEGSTSGHSVECVAVCAIHLRTALTVDALSRLYAVPRCALLLID